MEEQQQQQAKGVMALQRAPLRAGAPGFLNAELALLLAKEALPKLQQFAGVEMQLHHTEDHCDLHASSLTDLPCQLDLSRKLFTRAAKDVISHFSELEMSEQYKALRRSYTAAASTLHRIHAAYEKKNQAELAQLVRGEDK